MTVANPQAGGLTIEIAHDTIVVAMTGGGRWLMPLGVARLLDNELERADRPVPAQLTNALGIVHDYFDDVIVEAPSVLATPSVTFIGDYAAALAMVEVGKSTVPDNYQLDRRDADEVFRTLVAEPIADRQHNPGLPPAHVESIIATLCIVLSIMRRLGLAAAGIGVGALENDPGDGSIAPESGS